MIVPLTLQSRRTITLAALLAASYPSIALAETVHSVTDIRYDSRMRLLCTAERMDPAQWSGQTDACLPQLGGSQGPDRITKNVYDAAGQLLKVQKAVGTSLQQDYATYTYTNNGQQASVKDANGNLASMTYDSHDRQTRWTFPSKTSIGSVDVSDYEEYGYDANGNRTSLRKRDGSILTYSYDALNRNTVKVVPERSGLSATHTRDVYYGYDLRGLQTYARFDSTSGEGITTTYDGFGRPSTSTQTIDGVARTLTYAFDKNGNRTQVTYPDGNNFQFGYDGLDRMSIIGNNAPSGMTGYGYNNRGLRSSLASGSYTYYGYDPIGRMNALTQDIAGSTYDVTYGFGYNPASQMTTRTTSNDAFGYTGDVNVSRNYAVNGLNQYTSAGPATFTYDANGNLTGDGSSTYLYDVENRLVSAGGVSSASLRYDPLGRLYETSGGAAGTTRFLYDGDELVAEYASSGAMLRRYAHGSGSDDPMAWFEGASIDPSVAKLIKTNHQGSVTALVDWSGNLTNINTYDEWGIPAQTNTGRFQYTGQAWIPELRMYYYKARIYSPTLGRFLQTDPIGYDDQVNLYGYVGNDPVNNVDPSGTNEITVVASRCSSSPSSLFVCVSAVGLGSLVFIASIQNQNTIKNRPKLFLPPPPMRNEKSDADKEWDEVAGDAETGSDGQKEKDGGKAAAERDFGSIKGNSVGGSRENGTKVKVLPDGTKVVLRPSSDGRWTIERQSAGGRKPEAGSGRRIRYNN